MWQVSPLRYCPLWRRFSVLGDSFEWSVNGHPSGLSNPFHWGRGTDRWENCPDINLTDRMTRVPPTLIAHVRPRNEEEEGWTKSRVVYHQRFKTLGQSSPPSSSHSFSHFSKCAWLACRSLNLSIDRANEREGGRSDGGILFIFRPNLDCQLRNEMRREKRNGLPVRCVAWVDQITVFSPDYRKLINHRYFIRDRDTVWAVNDLQQSLSIVPSI